MNCWWAVLVSSLIKRQMKATTPQWKKRNFFSGMKCGGADGLRPITPKERQLTHRSLSSFWWFCGFAWLHSFVFLFFFSLSSPLCGALAAVPAHNPPKRRRKKENQTNSLSPNSFLHQSTFAKWVDWLGWNDLVWLVGAPREMKPLNGLVWRLVSLFAEQCGSQPPLTHKKTSQPIHFTHSFSWAGLRRKQFINSIILPIRKRRMNEFDELIAGPLLIRPSPIKTIRFIIDSISISSIISLLSL